MSTADFERARGEEMRRILRERQQRPSHLMTYGDWPPVATINKSFKVREPERIDWAAFRRRAWEVVIMYVLIADLGLLLIAARDRQPVPMTFPADVTATAAPHPATTGSHP